MTKRLTLIKLHSLHIVALLIVVLFVGSIGVGVLIQSNPFIKIFDNSVYQGIHHGYHSSLIDTLILPFNYNFLPISLSPGRMPSYFYFMVGFTLFYIAIYKRSMFWWAVLCFLLGTGLTFTVAAIDWHFVYRERPFFLLPNSVDEIGKSAWGNLSSYPSGHVRETTLYSTIIVNFIPQLKWVAVLFVIFIAYSRVYIGAHYPTDVLSAIIIGYIAAKATLIIARELQIIFDRRKGSQHDHQPKQT